jgi:glycosyltransferase involved in cell wall biosynthesis
MSVNPLVSVVVAAYETNADYFNSAIRSACGQTLKDIEILVPDDSRTDRLRLYADSFCDARIRYRHNSPPLGVARNHWAAVREARGKYVAVLNHDDMFDPTFLQRMVEPLEADSRLALSFCDHWVIGPDGARLAAVTDDCTRRWKRDRLPAGVHQPFWQLLADQSIPMVMGAVFRKELLPPALPDSAGPAYDLWIAFLLCRTGCGAYYTPDRLTSWRAHPENLTSQGGYDWFLGAAGCWAEVAASHLPRQQRRAARANCARAHLSCASASLKSGKRWLAFRHACQSLRRKPSVRGVLAMALPLVPFPFRPMLPRPGPPMPASGGRNDTGAPRVRGGTGRGR